MSQPQWQPQTKNEMTIYMMLKYIKSLSCLGESIPLLYIYTQPQPAETSFTFFLVV